MTILNYQFQPHPDPNAPVMMFIHGLFGDMNNLGIIARPFAEHYSILRIDLRNHGHSFHQPEMDYTLMAQDVLNLLDHLQLKKVISVGHSMGGKTSMTLAFIAPERVEKLIVIDIAPVAYYNGRHDTEFKALFAVKSSRPTTRQEARAIMQNFGLETSTEQFILKSFAADAPESFRFNVSALYENYDNIMGWQEVFVQTPTLFVKGGSSNYIQAKDTETILRQFPNAKSFVVANAHHWVHAEKPDAVIRAIQRFL